MRYPLIALCFSASLVFCGDAATARPRTVPDQLVAVAPDGQLQLKTLGAGTLAGIRIMDMAAFRHQLASLKALEVKSLGADRYGRARVLLFRPGAKEAVQQELLGRGTAILYDQYASLKSWKEAEAAAQKARHGAWAEAGWQATPEQVGNGYDQFRRVSGTITRVYAARDAYYINFGEDWKTDFSASIPRRYLRGFGKNFSIKPGQTVAVRGVIIHENGPMIVLTRPEQLEVMDGPS